MDDQELSKRIRSRWSELKLDREKWLSTCKEVSEYINPRNGRYNTTDRNLGNSRKNRILDPYARRAQRTLSAGLMSGMTSPARPWFKLTTSDTELAKDADVKQWLFDVSQIMQTMFAKSNIYRMLHAIYDELGLFGTAPAVLVGNFERVMHGFTLTAGEYCIGADTFGVIDSLYREYQMTTKAMVENFGDRCAPQVLDAYHRGRYDSWHTVLHAVEPRASRRDGNPLSTQMPYQSVYLDEQGRVLKVSGFKRFPVLCPRWDVCGSDLYGTSPAMDALPGVKQLQVETLRKAQGIDMQSNPVRLMPASLKNSGSSLLPGGTIWANSSQEAELVRDPFMVKPDLQGLLLDIQDMRQQIDQMFFCDLFRMFEGNTQQMTAYEVSERQQEKMLMLGPVLERLDNELLSPLIQNAFDRLMEAGRIPEPPEAALGQELAIEYISVMAQAQKAADVNNQTRFLNSLGVIAQLKPDVLDKFDADAAIDSLADAQGIDPKLIVPGKQVAMIREQRQQQQAQMMQQQQAAAGMQGLQAASQIDAQNLQDVMGGLQGYGDMGAGGF